MSEDTKKLGKITSAKFGLNDRDWLGVTIAFTGTGWGVCAWVNAKGADFHDQVKSLLEKAKVLNVPDLSGIPVEVTFDRNTLKSWRILEEVL